MSNFGDVVQEYYIGKFRRNAAIRQQKINALKNADDAWKYIAEVRQRVGEAFKFPATKCPLNLRIVGTTEKKDYVVKKLLYDSRPDFPVSANLYLPKKISGKIPGVLILCGHANDGKACDTYQTVAVSLCMKGCAVLIPDPIGQGERLQYPEIPNFSSCTEHNQLGRRLLLSGDCFGAWRVYDAIRSVDVLLTLPEVDPERLGVTGNSGGGTLTTLVNSVEPRLKAAAPSCYITRWVRNCENELPVDAEQIPPGVARNGGEMADLLIASAPNPLLILGQKNDFFDIRGTREVYEEVKQIYTLLGCPEKVNFFCGPTNHGYSVHNREAAYDFFNREFKLNSDGKEPEVELPKLEEVQCTPDGYTVHLPGTVSINDLMARQTRQQIANRKKYSEAELKKILADLLGIGDVPVPYYRQLRAKANPELQCCYARYGLETEPGIVATMLGFNHDNFQHIPASENCELYVPNQSSLDELGTRAIPKTRTVFGIDYRGVGESMPDGCDQYNRDFFGYYLFDYHYASLSLLFQESYLGGRVRDVIAAIKLLHASGNKHIMLTAAGIGRIPALLAAFLCDEPVELKLYSRIRTYANSALSEINDLPESMGIYGILNYTDLDEIQDLVEQRQ